jgi:3,4-dihydroxy 2-butanone 4-phosphate synthase / GTP cyclohydrolase II
MVDRVPLLIEATSYNADYLATKAEKLGHLLLQTYLITVAIQWQDDCASVTERYERLEKIRYLASTHDLLLQEEARSLATALFGQSAMTFHLGFDQSQLTTPDWYRQPDHPYVKAIAQILDALAVWDCVEQLEFLVSTGGDPLANLQVQLDRQIFHLGKISTAESVQPSNICEDLQTQRIYVFSRHTPNE